MDNSKPDGKAPPAPPAPPASSAKAGGQAIGNEASHLALSARFSVAAKEHGINANPADPRLVALASQGVSHETFLAACEEAVRKAQSGRQVALGYVIAILDSWARRASAIRAEGQYRPKSPPGRQDVDVWWTSNAGIDRKGREVGLNPRPMESYADYKARIFKVLGKRGDGEDGGNG